LEAVTFALAHRWFDCRLPAAARGAIEQLPPDLERWLDLYAASPIEGLFHANKDELWLHWSLLSTTRDRLAMVQRRLFPQRLPGPVDAVFVPKEKFTGTVRLRARWRYLTFTAGRVRHHLAALPPVFAGGIRWFAPAASLGSQYWQLFLSEAFFDFGMFVFFFLYNLYLLKLGFLEDTIGLISSVMTAGSIAGSLLAVLAMQRFGIRATLMASFALTAVLSALRASFINKPALLILAAISGIISAVWPVAFAPAIAGLTNQKNRPAGFSFMSAAGISIGVFGGLAASRLPGWLTRLHLASTSVVSYRESLLIGAAIVLLSIWPVSRVRFGAAPPPRDRRLRRPSPMVLRFLIAMVAWYLATGALNPFFNVFFTRRIHLPVENIGYVFSASQIAQIIAILAAPLVFRRFGLTRSISAMQLCTGIAMFALAAVGGPWWAAGAYAGYMMAQYMSEPGMFTLLMDIAPESERSSASALNFLVTFSGQAIAAAAAGRLLQQFGYPPVMIGAAVICAFAALLFLLLMSGAKPRAPSAP
jgi:MFS family permease